MTHDHAQTAFNEEVLKRLAALEKDIARLEKAGTAHALDNNSALGGIATLEKKQRAVNEAMLGWHQASGYEGDLCAALREALK